MCTDRLTSGVPEAHRLVLRGGREDVRVERVPAEVVHAPRVPAQLNVLLFALRKQQTKSGARTKSGAGSTKKEMEAGHQEVVDAPCVAAQLNVLLLALRGGGRTESGAGSTQRGGGSKQECPPQLTVFCFALRCSGQHKQQWGTPHAR